jgi:hypothetical protein
MPEQLVGVRAAVDERVDALNAALVGVVARAEVDPEAAELVEGGVAVPLEPVVAAVEEEDRDRGRAGRAGDVLEAAARAAVARAASVTGVDVLIGVRVERERRALRRTAVDQEDPVGTVVAGDGREREGAGRRATLTARRDAFHR